MFSLFLKKFFSNVDWLIVFSLIPIVFSGLMTMNSFGGNNAYFNHQIIWVSISFIVMFVASYIDWSFLKRTNVIVILYFLTISVLLLLFLVGTVSKGAQSWFNFGGFSIQPIDPAKVILIVLLAKYFSRRHVEIGHIKHIFVSGLYAMLVFLLVFLQPDFGGALIIFCIWFGMVLVSGISKKHLAIVFGTGSIIFLILWGFVFQDYQKKRILTFLHPLADIRGAGYNAYQSTITLGSGGLLGKGVGFGTQSRLKFLPEYETDFIFAAFAEEWGFVGVVLLFILYTIVIWRVLLNSMRSSNNFELLYGVGLSILFMSHFTVHVGMNMGLLPVTGLTIPFMSYGGSNMITFFGALGILMSMRRNGRVAHREVVRNEFSGLV
jgi:rod shape determining protein RodA